MNGVTTFLAGGFVLLMLLLTIIFDEDLTTTFGNAKKFKRKTDDRLNPKLTWQEIMSAIGTSSFSGSYQKTFDRSQIDDKYILKLLKKGFMVEDVLDEDSVICVSWDGEGE